MKIGFALNRSEGGPSGFLNKLKTSLQRQGLATTGYCFDPFVSCNIFSNKAYRFWYKPYLFRVDGVTFDSRLESAILKAKNKNLEQGIRHASGIIFQSEFSRKMTYAILETEVPRDTIILNGTDLTRFNSNGPDKRSELQIPPSAFVFVTSAKWRSHKRLKEIIQVFLKFKKIYNEQTYLLIIGEPDYIINDNNILYTGAIPNAQLPNYLRTGDCYLFLSWLDPCPNSVVEAIACGLPVICSNQGGTKEIIQMSSGGLIVEADKEFTYSFADLYNPPEVDQSVVVNAMLKLTYDYNTYKKQITTQYLDINYVARKYYAFINELIDS